MIVLIQKDFDIKYFDSLQKEMSKVPEVNPDTLIIFLDVDGVLNSGKWIEANQDKSFLELIDPAAVARVNSLKEKTNAKIVISSSWRGQFLNVANGFEKLTEFFAKYGVTDIVGMTPRFHGKRRCEEIQGWLNQHKIKNFVILDDDLSADVAGRQVKTFFEDGLQDHHIEEALRILCGNG